MKFSLVATWAALVVCVGCAGSGGGAGGGSGGSAGGGSAGGGSAGGGSAGGGSAGGGSAGGGSAGGGSAGGGSAGGGSAGPAEVMAMGIRPSGPLFVDATHAWWGDTSGGQVRRIELSTKTLSGSLVSGLSGVAGIILDNGKIYVLDNGGIVSSGGAVVRANISGTLPAAGEKMVVNQNLTKGFVLDNGFLYWGVRPGSSATVRRVAVDSDAGTSTDVLSNQGNAWAGIGVSGADVFGAQSPIIYKKAKDGTGTMATVVLGQTGLNRFTSDATGLYWLTGTGNNNDGKLFTAPLTGGTPVELATGIAEPYGIFVDTTHVYWIDRGAPDSNDPAIFPAGALRKVAKSGGAVTTLGSAIGNPIGLFVTSTHAYTCRESTANPVNGQVIRFSK